ncbi:ATP-binding cassette domain-containing protein [Micromonospora sp. NPDC051925]|uniref:ATP-binding cassette domain-containing protein n=1 Tax=Micromonospora sp. NPDC051925 TaxID=3364288 RepID=UPI0037C7385E
MLTGASCTVGRGVTALLGPNGAGKSTLIKCVVGLARPDEGRVVIDGRDVSDGKAAQALIGYVPQNPSLPGLAKVRDLVAYAAWLSGVDAARTDEAVKVALNKMQALDLGPRRIRTLSGGQRQRVALATGIVHDPQIVILDEPTVGLDPGQRLKVREVILHLGAERPVLLSTHLTEDVEHLADTVAVLAEGKIRYQGPLTGLATTRPSIDGRPGSPFECAYDDLIMSFGGAE